MRLTLIELAKLRYRIVPLGMLAEPYCRGVGQECRRYRRGPAQKPRQTTVTTKSGDGPSGVEGTESKKPGRVAGGDPCGGMQRELSLPRSGVLYFACGDGFCDDLVGYGWSIQEGEGGGRRIVCVEDRCTAWLDDVADRFGADIFDVVIW